MPSGNDDFDDYIAPNSELNKNANRRKYARRAVRWHASLITKEKQVFKATTRDVSEKGSAMVSSHNFPINSLLVVEIDAFHQGKTLKLRALAIVKHTTIASDGYVMGLFFKDASDLTTKFLKKFANSQI